MRTPVLSLIVSVLAVWSLAPMALAQFGTPGATAFRERIIGAIVAGDSGLVTDEGDQLGAFFEDELIGAFTFAGSDPAFQLTIFGDDPDTPVSEGPIRGQRLTLRYFDASTNSTQEMEPLNGQGEVFNLTFQGIEVFEVPGLPLDLTPSRNFDARPAGSSGGGGGGGGGGGEEPPGGVGTDVNGDGTTDMKDAAIILRCLGGAARAGSRAFVDLGILVEGGATEMETPAGVIRLSVSQLLRRCDVDNNGSITTRDAVVILRGERASPAGAGQERLDSALDRSGGTSSGDDSTP